MVYSNKFVLSVLFNDNILQERKDGIVPIPLYEGGSEYGLRFRNRHSRRAVVKFTIDGDDASGCGYIIPANEYVDIFRYSHKDAKFKFTSLDSIDAAAFGKSDNADGGKGVIEAKFYLEKRPRLPKQPTYVPHPVPQPYSTPQTWPHKPWSSPYPCGPKWFVAQEDNPKWFVAQEDNPKWFVAQEDNLRGILRTSSLGPVSEVQCHMSASAPPGPVDSVQHAVSSMQEGCTVEGSESGQMFNSKWIDIEEDYVALRIVLRGVKADRPEVQVVEVSHCTQCGAKRSRKSDKFCGACGHKF